MSLAYDEVPKPIKDVTEFYISLVREYADKLSSLCARASDLRYHRLHTGATADFISEAARLIELHECLRPVVEQLLSRSAAILDLAQEKTGPDLELALALRQEELEAQFRMAPVVFRELEAAFGARKIRELIEPTRLSVLK